MPESNSSLFDILSDFEDVLSDLKIETMFIDFFEHSAYVEKFDTYTVEMARSRSAAFLLDYVQAVSHVLSRLKEFHLLHEKIDPSSPLELGGSNDLGSMGSP